MSNNITLKNFLWRFFERCGAQIVSFIVTIVLARILDPNIYGPIAIVTVIINVLQVFVDSGLGTALIQKKDSDDLDFSSVFYFKIITCLAIYSILFFTAPLISSFFDDDSLTSIIRVLGLSVIIASVKNVEQAYVSKHLKFKAFFFATLIGTLVSAVVGVTMALNGFGVWALVAQALTNEFVDTVLLWIIIKWRPIGHFSIDRIKKLSAFGYKIFLASLIDSLYENSRQLIVGKKYSSSDLAFYNRGKQFPSILVVNLSTSLDSVLLPTMSKVQENIENVKKLVRKSITISCYAIFPIMFGMCVCSESIVNVLLTAKWAPAVIYMRIFCIAYSFYSINSAFKNGIKSIGKSGVFLVTEIIKKVLGFGMIIGSMFIGVEAIAVSFLISSLLNVLINIYPNKKYLGYGVKEQLFDVLPVLFLSLIMLATVFPLNFLQISHWFKLPIMVVTGVLIYWGGSVIFKLAGYKYFISVMKNFFGRKKAKGDQR